MPPLLLDFKTISYSNDSSNTFLLKIKNIVFELSSLSVWSKFRNIMCGDTFLKFLIRSQLCNPLMELSILLKLSTITKIYLNPFHLLFERRTFQLYIYHMADKIQYVLLLHFLDPKKTSFSYFCEACSIV